MARKSKYNKTNNNLIKKWDAALYIRLSREDGDSEESESISNQRNLLNYYVEQNADISVFNLYIDDGYTGTNFERPGFCRLLKDMEEGLINCIIVKDLSRFGRDYIEVGEYLEKIFPKYNVRFIAINDNYDSLNPVGSNYIIPFKSIINDKYAEDISIKVRSTFDAKRKRGEFIGAFAPYGYIKDPNNKNKLLIDNNVAWVIKKIYSLLIEGYSKIDIARDLNSINIPCPTEYKKQQGLKYENPIKLDATAYWTYSTIHKILKNEVYIGNMVQKKYQVKSYKIKDKVQLDESQWIRKNNTHEAIIDKETWNKVQDILSRDTKKMNVSKTVHIFAGYLRCGDCGRAMHRNYSPYTKKDGVRVEWYNFLCGSYAVYRNCTRHTIKENLIYEIVLNDIRKNAKLALATEEIIAALSEEKENKIKKQRISSEIDSLKRESKKIYHLKKSIYEDWKSDILSKEDYLAYKEDYEKQQLLIEERLRHCKKIQAKNEDLLGNDNQWLVNFKRYADVEELDRDIIVDLIECIYVYEKDKERFIEIKYKYQDEFKALLESLPKE